MRGARGAPAGNGRGGAGTRAVATRGGKLSAGRMNCATFSSTLRSLASSRTTAPSPINVTPPTTAVVPAMIRALPRLNSRIATAKPIAIRPAVPIMIPSA